jgi:outer membrane protein TolC
MPKFSSEQGESDFMPRRLHVSIKRAVYAGLLGTAMGGCVTVGSVGSVGSVVSVGSVGSVGSDLETEEIPINLPSALARIGGTHPVVGHAQWRVQEAYAQLDRAELMWLPSIQAGFNYHRHDGNYQAINGTIVDINSNSFQAGLGAGAIAAGTTPRPGLVAQFHLADAIFLPKVAQRAAWAKEHAALAVENQQMLTASLAYVELLDAYQEESLLIASSQRIEELSRITGDYAQTGSGLVSDSQRLSTEESLAKLRVLGSTERKWSASTRLARALSIPGTSKLVPLDAMVVPLQLVELQNTEQDQILGALHRRPELAEAQALVLAASAAYERERSAPFVPSVLLGYSTGTFGGGLGNSAGDWGGRYDIDALMSWELRNMGLGEQAARRERQAQVQQAMYSKLRMMDQVAQEVAESRVQVMVRREQIEVSQRAVDSAKGSYEKNLERIRQGQGLPIEVLQSVQAYEAAQRVYLRAVSDNNRAQLQLLWAIGWEPDCLLASNPQ